MKRITFLLALLFSLSPSFSQNLDSLLTAAKQSKNDSIIIRAYNRVGSAYIFRDTKKALQIIDEGEKLAKEKKFHFGLNELINTRGIYMDVIGKSDSANYYFTQALNMSRRHNFKNIEVMCVNNLGMFNWNRSHFDEALKYFFEALRMNDKDGTERQSASYLNNIGLIYQEMNLFEKALEYHQKSLAIREKYNLKDEQATSLNNIGIDLKSLGKIDEAIGTFIEGSKIAIQTENLVEYYRILNNLANAYQMKDDVDKAIETYLQVLDKPNDYEADEKASIDTYGNLVLLYNSLNEPQKALFYANKGFELVKKYPHSENIAGELYLNAAESQYMLRNFSKARELTQKFITIKDSVFSDKNAKAVADLEIKYDTEKKEKQILIQRAELAEKNLTIQEKNLQVFGLLSLAIVLGLIGFLFYNQQKLKNKQLHKENELKDALIRIETQNKLQEQRLRISRDLHDNIGAQLAFIISSIDNLKYGFNIQDEKLNQKLSNISEFTSSTIYELRDTIWAMNKSEITFEDLQTRISNYIDKAHVFEDKINFSFNVAEGVDLNRKFSSVEGMNIHRVIQEAIHNSLKHGNPSQIRVDVSQKLRNLQFEVSDDGKGFDLEAIQKGNGLINMQKRIQEIGGELSMQSESQKGTKVTILL
ncbi:tetratricopeptide repeat protein [Subsaxibacter sp. CAU 1640]|uniref:tetratricopeptide repeat-containing sensor histidine kinase n=1 Tax=Subsaxibacter sp. CAU 1640 TaxID=2933271 RepID=UPI0020064254|nr:tetratricopeptide repeat protein [Subsaxibacter sp. CAU 1640]MCK7591532.1 tetratricopeptide repeat protein [Subsaxibacter sp. CAU 1640]